MTKRLASWLLYRLMGWQKDVAEPMPDKCVVCVAPHTSNWDFIIGELYSLAEGLHCGFLMKQEWFHWPLGSLLRKLGGIPVKRQKHTSLTDQLAKRAREEDHFRLAVTPEGTRKRTEEWKKGFYFIALKAELPILLYGLDYAERRIVCKKTLVPSGDLAQDMRLINDYYKDFKGKFPEKFSIDTTT